jgi:hypothetical protein
MIESNRRFFLKVIGLIAGGTALSLGPWSCSDSDEAESTRLDPLTDAELDGIVALSIALFEPEDDRERLELDSTMRWWAKGRTTRGPHLQLYRDGLAALKSGTANAGTNKAKSALHDELLEGIYSSAVGWKSLGYTTWPGVPSASQEYTTRPHGPTRVTAMPIGEPLA